MIHAGLEVMEGWGHLHGGRGGAEGGGGGARVHVGREGDVWRGWGDEVVWLALGMMLLILAWVRGMMEPIGMVLLVHLVHESC